MKRLLLILVVAVVVFATLVFLRRQDARHAQELAALRAAWGAERAELQALLEEAQAEARRRAATPSISAPVIVTNAVQHPEPGVLLEELFSLRLQAESGSSRAVRRAVYLLEELALAGPAALPAIGRFLQQGREIELDTSWLQQNRSAREGRLPGDFVLPPSVRLGLFEVLRRIGGADAEKLLTETLAATGRGLEVAYLTRLLEEMAPGKYREYALSIARNLLAAGAGPANSASLFDRYHRDFLFGVLSQYGDSEFAPVAQAQLLSADSQVDRTVLRYLQQTLGAGAVPIVAQAYQNPGLQTNAAAKEPLARLALSFVGADVQANQFYQQAINDPVLTKGHRKNLIEDLNQDGFKDTRNLTPTDLPLIQNRIALIEQLAPHAMDPVNAAAFAEAYKDLLNMRARLTAPAPPSP